MAEEQESTLDTIRDLKQREPFLPFWIVLTSGERYVIENSEGLAIGSSQLHYYPPRSDRPVHLRISQIAAVEELELKRGA